MDSRIVGNEHRYQILVVDDLPEIRSLMARVLEGMGHRVLTADCAEEALVALNEFRAEVIFSDICMADMNGYELVRQLRRRPDTRTRYVIAMSGNIDKCSEDASLVAGFDAHLVKPFPMEILHSILSDIKTCRFSPMSAKLKTLTRPNWD